MKNKLKLTESFEQNEFRDLIEIIRNIEDEELSKDFDTKLDKNIADIRQTVLSRRNVKSSFWERLFDLVASHKVVMALGFTLVFLIAIPVRYYYKNNSSNEIVAVKKPLDTIVRQSKSNAKASAVKQQKDMAYWTDLSEDYSRISDYGFAGSTVKAEEIKKMAESPIFTQELKKIASVNRASRRDTLLILERLLRDH